MRIPAKLQIGRRFTQIFVLFLVCLSPVLARYVNYVSACQLDRGMEKPLPRKPSESLMQAGKPGHGTGNSRSRASNRTLSRDQLAPRVEKRTESRAFRSALPKVKRLDLSRGSISNQREAAPAEVPGLWQRDRQREGGGDRGVCGAASGSQDMKRRSGCRRIACRDHRVAPASGFARRHGGGSKTEDRDKDSQRPVSRIPVSGRR